MNLRNQCLLRIATAAWTERDRALVHHNCESETRMLFGFRHHQLRGLVRVILIAVPVDNDSINTAADHVRDLRVNLRRIVRAVTDIDVNRVSPPGHKVGDDLGIVSGIEQAVDVYLADVAGPDVAVGLRSEAICCAGVV